MKNQQKTIIATIFICSLIFSFFNWIDFSTATVQESGRSLITGDNANQGYNYTYTGTYYDDVFLTHNYSTANVNFTYVPAETVSELYSISDNLTNYESLFPRNYSIPSEMISGTFAENGTLDVNEIQTTLPYWADYSGINSTTSEVEKITSDNQVTEFDIKDRRAERSLDKSFQNGTDFYGEYSFVGDAVGASGVAIGFIDTDNSGADCDAEIVAIEDDHKKTLELDDQKNGACVDIEHNIAGEASGTMEFWYKSNNTGNLFQLDFYDGPTLTGTKAFTIKVDDDDLDYFSTGWHSAVDNIFVDNQWNHFQINFECGAGGYKGLGADDFSIYLNNVLYGNYNFDSPVANIDKAWIRTGNVLLGYAIYLDAIDFSWSAGYCNERSNWTDISSFTTIDNDWAVFESEENAGPTYDLEFNVELDVSTVSEQDNMNIFYSYNTTSPFAGQTCNFSVYNFNTGDYDLIEDEVRSSFSSNVFHSITNDSYYNATDKMLVSFDLTNASDEFTLRLETLYVRTPSIIEFTTNVTVSDVTNLLELDVESWQRTNNSDQLMHLRAYDWTTSNYTLLNVSRYDTTFQQLHNISLMSVDDFVNTNGTICLKFYGINYTSDFSFEINALNCTLYSQTTLTYSHALNLLGLWKYRFELDDGLPMSYNSSWQYINVIQAVDNFYAISESEDSTRWIVQEASLTPTQDFHDDINTNYWNLVDVSDYFFNYSIDVTRDSYTAQNHPNTNYGTDTSLYVLGSIPGWARHTYLFFPGITSNYLFNNKTGDDEIWLYTNLLVNFAPGDLEMYTADASFLENTITWNDSPSPNVLQDTITPVPGGSSNNVWYFWNITDYDGFYELVWDVDIGNYQADFQSRESTNIPYYVREGVSKNFFGNHHMYMQTNTTETISLESQVYGTNYSLDSGEYFEVELETNSDSEIDLLLYSGGILQETLVLSSSGNTDHTNHTEQIAVSSTISFDQIKISSTFDDGDYVKVSDIKTYNYTVIGDSLDFYVDPDGINSGYLSPETYTIKIYMDGNLKEQENITITSGEDYYYIYEPIEQITCRLSFFNPSDEFLEFQKFHVYYHRTVNNDTISEACLDNIFTADVGTTIDFEVYDFLDYNTIKNATVSVKSFIDIKLDVYSLTIKNIMAQETIVTINTTKTYELLKEETLDFLLLENDYEINWTDDSGEADGMLITLNSNQAYELNTTYYDVYFSIFNYDGLGLDENLFKLYINGIRSDFGKNSLSQDTNTIQVLDYFNSTIFSKTRDFSGLSEYSIQVTVLTVTVINNFENKSILIKFERDGFSDYIAIILSPSTSTLFKLVPSVEYEITAYEIDGIAEKYKIDNEVVELDLNDEDYYVVEFGFYTGQLPEDITPFNNIMTIFWFFVFFAIIAMISIIAYRKSSNQQKEKKIKKYK